MNTKYFSHIVSLFIFFSLYTSCVFAEEKEFENPNNQRIEDVQKTFDLDDSWERLTPGESQNGFLLLPNQSKVGFRGMGVKHTVSGNSIDSEGYLSCVIEDREGNSFVYNKSSANSSSMNVFINGKRINESPSNGNVGSGITKFAYQQKQTTFFFKNEELNQLKGIMYTNDGFDVELTLSIDERSNAISQTWNFINNTDSSEKISVAKAVDLCVDGDSSVAVRSLGNNIGFYAENQNLFISKIADFQGKYLSEFNKFYVGEFNQINNSIYFGSDFTTPGQEILEHRYGDQLTSGTDSGYQLGTDVKMIQPNERFKVTENIYYGTKLLPELSVASNLEKKVYKSMSSLPVTLNVKDELGKSEDVYIQYGNSNPELYVKDLAIDQKTNTCEITKTIDITRLNNGHNTIELFTIDDEMMKSEPLKIDVEVIEPSATPNIVKVARNTLFDPDIQRLIEKHNFIHEPQLSYREPMEEIDTSEIGFHWAYITLKDSVTPELGYLDLDIPINVYGENTTFFNFSSIAVDVPKSIDLSMKEVEKCSTEEEINQLVENNLSVKSWDMTNGEKLITKIIETDIVKEIGSYNATLSITNKNKVIAQKDITVNVQANMGIADIPKSLEFQSAKINSKLDYINKKNPLTIKIDSIPGRNWLLTASVSNFTTADGDAVSGILINKRGDNDEEIIDDHSNTIIASNDGSSMDYETIITMEKNEGLLLKIFPGQVKAKAYRATITWTLNETPI